MKVLPNTPASKAGPVPGLVLRKIDGTTTAGKLLKECVDMLGRMPRLGIVSQRLLGQRQRDFGLQVLMAKV
jgi:hypothetical protein